jgi:hypothetical protein
MQRLSGLLLAILVTSMVQAQQRPDAIRVCVFTANSTSGVAADKELQRNVLVKALERTNKDKDVKNGKAAPIEAIPLELEERDKDCPFVLSTDVGRFGASGIALGPDADVTVNYRMVRSGDKKDWTSGTVSAHGQPQDKMLVLQLMEEVASRVAKELRTPRPAAPQ